MAKWLRVELQLNIQTQHGRTSAINAVIRGLLRIVSNQIGETESSGHINGSHVNAHWVITEDQEEPGIRHKWLEPKSAVKRHSGISGWNPLPTPKNSLSVGASGGGETRR